MKRYKLNITGEPDVSAGRIRMPYAVLEEDVSGAWCWHEDVAALEAQLQEAQADNQCTECNGTGKEICNNPDHGFIDSLGIGNGCPLCGRDELHRIPNAVCGACGGSGKRTAELQAENAALKSQLALTEKALELACDEIERLKCSTHPSAYESLCNKKYFLQQAKAGVSDDD